MMILNPRPQPVVEQTQGGKKHDSIAPAKCSRMVQDGCKLPTYQLHKVMFFVKCRCYIYMNETFTLQLARASGI
jgi:hypothetical protein